MLDQPPFASHRLDVGEANCSRVVLLIYERIKEMRPGEIVEVLAYDSSITIDIMAWCRQTGHPLVYWRKSQGAGIPAYFFIQRKEN
mgnify:CR=1 FL=1